MRWLEDILADRWWSTGTAVRVVERGRPAGEMTYGELLPRAAGLAATLAARTEGRAAPHVAVVAADGPAQLVADLAGLIAGTAVVSVPPPRHPAGHLAWPAGVLDDLDVVVADGPGAAAVQRDTRTAGRRAAVEVLPISLAATRTVAVAPELGAEQDDVCKVAFLDAGASRRALALTGHALDTVISALCRQEAAAGPAQAGPAVHTMASLVGQLGVYRTLAMGGTVVFRAPRTEPGRPLRRRPSRYHSHGAGALAAPPPAPVEAIADDAAISGLIRELVTRQPVTAERHVRVLRPARVSA